MEAERAADERAVGEAGEAVAAAREEARQLELKLSEWRSSLYAPSMPACWSELAAAVDTRLGGKA